ncbi:hypothetical protein HR12_42700 [Microbacterium sp. SUBG005]|nr:hypothetical protein HR12_42700 [Microbacterium sp. SUBG005]
MSPEDAEQRGDSSWLHSFGDGAEKSAGSSWSMTSRSAASGVEKEGGRVMVGTVLRRSDIGRSLAPLTART